MARFVFVHIHTKVGQVYWYIMSKQFHRVEYAQQKRSQESCYKLRYWYGTVMQ